MHTCKMWVRADMHLCTILSAYDFPYQLHIAQANISVKHMSNAHGATMRRKKNNGGDKLYRVIGN